MVGRIPRSLRIVVWNANMAVHRKLDALKSLEPDVHHVELIPGCDLRLEWIAPVEVRGPHSFFLLAAWCMNHRARTAYPVHPHRQVDGAVRCYADRLDASVAVVAGGFNNNTTWDRPGRDGNFTETVDALAGAGLVSADHRTHGAEFGQESDPDALLAFAHGRWASVSHRLLLHPRAMASACPVGDGG